MSSAITTSRKAMGTFGKHHLISLLAVAAAGTLWMIADAEGTLITRTGAYWLRDWSLLLGFTLAIGFAVICFAACRRSSEFAQSSYGSISTAANTLSTSP